MSTESDAQQIEEQLNETLPYIDWTVSPLRTDDKRIAELNSMIAVTYKLNVGGSNKILVVYGQELYWNWKNSINDAVDMIRDDIRVKLGETIIPYKD